MKLNNRIVTKNVVKEFKSSNGLWVPSSLEGASYKKLKVVRSAGRKLPKGVNEGDTLYVKPYAGKSVLLDGEDCVVVERADVLLIED